MNRIGRVVEAFLIWLFVTAMAFTMLSGGPATRGPASRSGRVSALLAAAMAGTAAAWFTMRRSKARSALPAAGAAPKPPSQGVAPPPPPPSDDSPVLKLASQEGCLAVRHVFPPRHPQRSLSFLGGSPMAPPDFEWPMAHNAKGLLEWLPFAGQIDCAKLPPDCPVRPLLPKEGVLYFFLPGAGRFEESQKVAVRYHPGRPAANWEVHQGLVLPPLNGEENARYRFRWMNWLPNAKASYPRCYQRVEIELGWVGYGGEVLPEDKDAEDGFPWDVAAARHRANLRAFHGEPVEHNPFFDPFGKPADRVWRVHEGFPLSWHAVAVAGGHLRVQVQEERARLKEWQEAAEAAASSAKPRVELPDTPENLTAVYDRLERAASDLMMWTFRGLEEPAPENKAAFWALFDSLHTTNKLPLIAPRYRHESLGYLVNKWLAEAAILSAEACLADAGAAGRVPAEVVAALGERHSVLKRHMFEDKGWHLQHQMFGRGRSIQVAADEMAETHHLLLQIGPDDAMDWEMGDNGAYQFWIAPADLAALRFDKVVVTFECH